jgi:hypothetical protein
MRRTACVRGLRRGQEEERARGAASAGEVDYEISVDYRKLSDAAEESPPASVRAEAVSAAGCVLRERRAAEQGGGR